MKRLTRTIGYVKPELRKDVVEPKSESPKEEPKTTEPDLAIMSEMQKSKSLKITKWINSRKGFKWGVMCTELKIDRGNFQRTLKKEQPIIKAELIPEIEKFLETYGYAR